MAINGNPARIEGSGTYGIQSERCMYGKCTQPSSATIGYFPGGPLINYCSNRCRKLHLQWDKDHYNALKAASAGDDHEGDEITAEDEDDNGTEVEVCAYGPCGEPTDGANVL